VRITGTSSSAPGQDGTIHIQNTLTVASGGFLLVDPARRLLLDNGADIVVASGARFGTTGFVDMTGFAANPNLCPSIAQEPILSGLDTLTPSYGGCFAQVQDPNSSIWWEVGDVVHCPSAADPTVDDCAGAGDANEMAICYPDARYDIPASCVATADQGCQFYDKAIDAIDATTDVANPVSDKWLVFWDRTGDNPARDFSARYRLDRIDTTSTRNCMVVKLDKGCHSESAGCPHDAATGAQNDGTSLEERRIGRATLTGVIRKGTRLVTVTNGQLLSHATATLGGTRKGYRYLTCPDAQGKMPGWSALILETRPGANPDEILLDPLGVREEVQSGSLECRIDYGWRRGDAFFVMQPAIIASTTDSTKAHHEDNSADIAGDVVDMSFMFWEGMGSDIDVGGVDTAVSVDLDGTDLLTGNFTSFIDSNSLNATGVQISLDGTAGKTLTGWAIQGSDPDGGTGEEGHGILFQSVPGATGNNGATYDGFFAFAHSDDAWLPADANPSTGVTIKRFRCAGFSSSRNDASGGCLDTGGTQTGGGATTTVTLQDWLIQDGIHWSSTSAGIAVGRNNGFTGSNLVSVASDNPPVFDGSAYEGGFDFTRPIGIAWTNVLSLRDNTHEVGGGESTSLSGRSLANATFFETITRRNLNPATLLCNPVMMVSADAVSVRKVLFHNYEVACENSPGNSRWLIAGPQSGVMEDVAVIDLRRSVAVPAGEITQLFRYLNAASGTTKNSTVRRLTLGWPSGRGETHELVAYFGFPGPNALTGPYLMEGLWIHGAFDSVAFTENGTSYPVDPDAVTNTIEVEAGWPQDSNDVSFANGPCVTESEIYVPVPLSGATAFDNFPTSAVFGGSASMDSSFEPVGEVRHSGCGSRGHGARPGMYFMRALGFDVADWPGGTAQGGSGAGTFERRSAW
jgi:hypothetical protein